MQPFVTNFGDYHILVNHEDLQKLPASPLEAALLREGEVSTGKHLRLSIDRKQQDDIAFSVSPEDAMDWDEIRLVSITLSLSAYKTLDAGKCRSLHGQRGQNDILVKYEPC